MKLFIASLLILLSAMTAIAAEVFPDKALDGFIILQINPTANTALIQDSRSGATVEIKTGDVLGAEKKQVVKIGAHSIEVMKDKTITVIRAEVAGFKH